MTFKNPYEEPMKSPQETGGTPEIEVIALSRKKEDGSNLEIILRKKPGNGREAFDGIEKSTIGGVEMSVDAAYNIWKEYCVDKK